MFYAFIIPLLGTIANLCIVSR